MTMYDRWDEEILRTSVLRYGVIHVDRPVGASRMSWTMHSVVLFLRQPDMGEVDPPGE